MMGHSSRADEKNYTNELIDIIDKLIANIRLKEHESELNAEKIMHLQQLKTLVCAENLAMFPGDEPYDSYLARINDICQSKRSVVHYWSTPHHVKG